VTDENVFIAATCREKGITFLKGEATANIRKIAPERESSESAAAGAAPPRAGQPGAAQPAAGADVYTVTVGEHSYTVRIDGDTALVDGSPYPINITEGPRPNAAPAGAGRAASTATHPATRTGDSAGTSQVPVAAPLPGLVLRINVSVGDRVSAGDLLLVLESMKMENPLVSPSDGIVREIRATAGEQVAADQVLVTIGC
jgi:pyruvate carboxylase subunit B